MFAVMANNSFACWLLIISALVSLVIVGVQSSAMDRYATLTGGMVIGTSFSILVFCLLMVMVDHYFGVRSFLRPGSGVTQAGGIPLASYEKNILTCLSIAGFGTLFSIGADMATGVLIKRELKKVLVDYSRKLKKTCQPSNKR